MYVIPFEVIKCSFIFTASAGGGGGAQGPSSPKMAKSLAINNVHGKHARPMPGTPGLHNNSLIHQVCVSSQALKA